MSEIEKFSPETEKESTPEKESKPEKIILFIRHPSVEWLDFLLEKAESEGKDIETYAPVDVEGLKMTRLLSEYLQKNLPKIIGEENLDKKFTIYTSPIKRAKAEAEIISKNLKLAHLENLKVPTPANNVPIELECFAEVPWINKRQEAMDLIEEAKQQKVHLLKLWFQKDPDRVVNLLNSQIPKVEQGLQLLKNSKEPINVVCTHRLISALTFWYIEQKNKGRKDLTVTKEDLTEISSLSGKIAYTSFSEVRRTENQWNIISLGETPHFEKNPELKKGLY